MRILGWRLSNGRALFLSPLLIVVLPFLLILFFMGNNLAGAIMGPPAIWNRTWHSPPPSDVVGRYSESGRRLDRGSQQPTATLTLAADGSVTAAGLPYEFGNTSCTLSGRGSWSGPDDDQKINLHVIADGAPGSCESGSYPFLELSGHSTPYTLYWVVGDPDSGIGVWLRKQ